MNDTTTYDHRLARAGNPSVPFEGLVRPTFGIAEAISEIATAATRLAARAGAAAYRRFQISRTVRVLSALDDRTLADIGLDRHAIREAARAAVDGESGGIRL